MNLTEKEKMLLKDQQTQEELCVKKYTESANKAYDPVLKQLCLEIASHEQQHLDTVTQMLNGQVPNMNQSQNQQSSAPQNNTANEKKPCCGCNDGTAYDVDKHLCEDLLSTEKYVSSTYNTAIFEFTDAKSRDVLNHIQKEEQHHGKQLFDYMSSRNMYNVQ